MQIRVALPSDKLYFKIGEVAGIVGVAAHVLRYWETEFRSLKPQKSSKQQRVYRRRDVETLLRIKHLLYTERFTIAGAKRRLKEDPQSSMAPPSSDSVARASLGRVREAVSELRALLDVETERTAADPAALVAQAGGVTAVADGR
ncbi:MAG: MerR family transcriptional regulator [Nannocystaceae bacterium]|nr:MerR family transcriptional regulator [Nannocystaceae bacterium]